jgi:Transposase DDE domain/Domain of unknown function (DUF4372)
VKNENRPQPTRSKFSVFRQLCNLIPNHLVPKLARQHRVDEKARSFSPWSQVVALLYSQFTHAVGLNDVCDALHLHSGPLSAIRGATPPSRNGLSHANRHRDPAMAEDLFWQMLEHLKSLCPTFAGGSGRRLAGRFTRSIQVVDSTVLELVASCMDWAKHRRRKAAAKCHVRLDLQSFLPRFILIDSARHADGYHARSVCSGLRAGEIALFDRAYVDFAHLAELTARGVFWVTRAKESHQFRVIHRCRCKTEGRILRDDLVVPKVRATRTAHPGRLRRVVALVEVDGKEVEMSFLTNHLEWAASSVVALYKERWGIEVFFKQLKQTLQLSDFIGNSANAVRWQVWVALLMYLLLRFQMIVGRWTGSLVRLWALLRSSLWLRLDLLGLVEGYGTAQGPPRLCGRPEAAFLPGFG